MIFSLHDKHTPQGDKEIAARKNIIVLNTNGKRKFKQGGDICVHANVVLKDPFPETLNLLGSRIRDCQLFAVKIHEILSIINKWTQKAFTGLSPMTIATMPNPSVRAPTNLGFLSQHIWFCIRIICKNQSFYNPCVAILQVDRSVKHGLSSSKHHNHL